MENKRKIAFLGTGLMGFAMAGNLVRAGHDVRVWNRTMAKAEPLGAICVNTPDAAVLGVGIVFSMVSDGLAVGALVGDTAAQGALGTGAIWVDMSSTKTAEAKGCARQLADVGADSSAVRDALKSGFADSTILKQHGQRMSTRDFTPGGPSYIQLKDLENVLGEAEASDLTLPMVAAVKDRYARYITDLGGGGRDHAGLFEELLDLNDTH